MTAGSDEKKNTAQPKEKRIWLIVQLFSITLTCLMIAWSMKLGFTGNTLSVRYFCKRFGKFIVYICDLFTLVFFSFLAVIVGTSAVNGQGFRDGLDWLVTELRKRKAVPKRRRQREQSASEKANTQKSWSSALQRLSTAASGLWTSSKVAWFVHNAKVAILFTVCL